VLQCVAVCCSVLQCVAVCCSVLQCVAACCSVLQCVAVRCSALQCAAVCYSVCTKSFLESSGSRTRALETSAYRPRLTCQWYKSGKEVVGSDLKIQIEQKR